MMHTGHAEGFSDSQCAACQPISTFNPRTYWPAMGPWLAGPGAVSPEHIHIEGLLRQLLPLLNTGAALEPDYWRLHQERQTLLDAGALESELETPEDPGVIHSVLDVGCGRGRLASLLGEALPSAHYTGLDIGEAQLEATMKVRPDGNFYKVPIQEFDKRHKFDLVLVSEVLMHIPPAEIQQAVDVLLAVATKYILLIEWTQPIGDVVPAEWNWIHDYRALFGDKIESEDIHALQSIFLIKP